MKLKSELKTLKDANQEVTDTTTQSSDSQQTITNLKQQLKAQILRGNEYEEQLVEAKMSWATLDMEVDQL